MTMKSLLIILIIFHASMASEMKSCAVFESSEAPCPTPGLLTIHTIWIESNIAPWHLKKTSFKVLTINLAQNNFFSSFQAMISIII